MNTNLIASLLLPAALSTSLCAQELSITSSASPHALQVAVRGASRGELVVLVIGAETSAIRLPDGQVLGVRPDALLVQPAEVGRATVFADRLPITFVDWFFFVQAIAFDPRLPLDAKGTIARSPVAHL